MLNSKIYRRIKIFIGKFNYQLNILNKNMNNFLLTFTKTFILIKNFLKLTIEVLLQSLVRTFIKLVLL